MSNKIFAEKEEKVFTLMFGLFIGAMIMWAFSTPAIKEVTPEVVEQMTVCEQTGGAYTFNSCKW